MRVPTVISVLLARRSALAVGGLFAYGAAPLAFAYTPAGADRAALPWVAFAVAWVTFWLLIIFLLKGQTPFEPCPDDVNSEKKLAARVATRIKRHAAAMCPARRRNEGPAPSTGYHRISHGRATEHDRRSRRGGRGAFR
jgi:hypothetical protein